MSQLLSEKFKYLIEYKSGYTWSKDQENTKKEDGSIRVLTVTNVQKTLDLKSELYLTKVSENDKIEKAVSKDWTIAVSSNGNRSRIGNAIFVENDSEYLFASFLTAFKPKVDFLDPKYFYYWFSSDYVQQSISSVAEGSTGLSNLDIRYLRNMDIKYHNSSDEQKAIATILSKVDEAIETTKQTINSAQKLKTSLMQNLLTGKIKPDGTKRKDDEFYYDEKLGKVPKGWDVKNISHPTICKINPNYSIPKTTNEFPFLPMDAINDKFNGIGKIEKISGSLSGYTKFKKHDILFAKITPSTENGKVALVDIEEEFEIGFASTEFLVFQPNQDFVEPKFLYYKLIKNDIHFLAVSLMEGTSGRQRVPSKIFKNRVFSTFPTDKNEQKAIADKISEIDNIIIIKQNKIAKLENLKKSLMQNLLTGKMRLDEKLIKELISHV
ncbi:restriction endonuclease subunit S [Aliarcobacter butzleri]|uniref:restriction endonuclease subunit S n=1 Tax=Aliarcobacter butzleri TaxID=28197 RepID=UPI001EDB053F|nr:restriction endonuclease subunit S [Aliarcobacter butzleri]MCG3662670.1 restriction endonuclease subunit S [Aliarcobacter butzleri]